MRMGKERIGLRGGRVVVDEFEGGGGEPRRKAGGAEKERERGKERTERERAEGQLPGPRTHSIES